MRIVFCIKNLAGISGGAEWVLASVANGLAARGQEVHVVSFDEEGQPPFYEFSASVQIKNLGHATRGKKGSTTQFWKMRNHVASLHPDVIFGFLPSTFVILSILFWRSPYRFVSCEHISRDWYKGRLFKYLAVSLAGILSTKISFLSLDIAKEFPLIPERRKVILHNPVRTASKEADVMGISKSQYLMLNVGRLVEFKDQKTLIAAFGMIADEFPNWRLKIIGQGPLRAELDRTIEGLGLSKVVEIIDKSKRIEDEYANADLFVSSSIYEGFGLVTAEASSTGLPCVGFHDAEGTNKIIKDGVNGVLIEHDGNKVFALASGLRQLIADRRKMRRLGKNGVLRPATYEIDNVLDTWQDVLKLVGKAS